MPLLAVLMPANASYFLTMFISVLNFNIIPTQTKMKYLFKYNQAINNKLSPEYSSLGYGSSDIISNLGTVLLMLVGLVLAAILIAFLKIFSSKSKLVKKVYEMLRN